MSWLLTCSQLARLACPDRQVAANHRTASVEVRIVLAALPPAASRRANELISAWSIPVSSCLGCGKRGGGVVMGIALPLVARHPHLALPRARTPTSAGQ